MKKHEIMIIWEAINSNPNGDPDAGNSPRQDVISGKGYTTDVCIKRKIRDAVSLIKGLKDGFDIIIKNGESIEKSISENVTDGSSPESIKDNFFGKFCKRFWDVRAFGGVFSTGSLKKYPWAKITGPVQISFSESVSKIYPQNICITRCIDTKDTDKTTMGRKDFIPYGIYITKVFVNPFLCERSGFTDDDYDVLVEAIKKMFDLTKSSSRPEINIINMYEFTHEDQLGSAPTNVLFDGIVVSPKIEEPSCRGDYDFFCRWDTDELPDGITLTKHI